MAYYDRIDDVGGGKVRRAFRQGSRYVRAGELLTAAEIKAMPLNNRRSLIDKGYIAIWPEHEPTTSGSERFLVHKGFGAYDVVEGRKLNDRPLTREEASKLAGHN